MTHRTVPRMSTWPQSASVVPPGLLDSRGARELWEDAPRVLRWYAVFTLARHEKRVFAQCERRQIESFLPLYKVRHQWKNRCTVDLELPLFPSYSFVRIDPQARVQVLKVPGVIRIVSSGHQLQSLPDEYVNALRDGLLAHRIEPYTESVVGDWVRIKSGPMAGAEGVLERRKNELRVVLRLEMLERSVSVEVGADEIQWCGAPLSYS